MTDFDNLDSGVTALQETIEATREDVNEFHDPENSLEDLKDLLSDPAIDYTLRRFRSAPRSSAGLILVAIPAVLEHLRLSDEIAGHGTEDLAISHTNQRKLKSALDRIRKASQALQATIEPILDRVVIGGLAEEQRALDGADVKPVISQTSTNVREVTLRWWLDAEVDVSEYIISYREFPDADASALQTTVVGNVTSATVGELHDGAIYQFWVTPLFSWGLGAQSDPVVTDRLPDVPASPTIQAITCGIDEVTITWSPGVDQDPPHDTQAFIISYEEGPLEKTVTVDAKAIATAQPPNSVTLDGLKPGESYSFTIKAVNDVGQSTSSATGTSQPLPQVPQAPAPPTFVPEVDGVVLSWRAPAGDLPITGYMVWAQGPGLDRQFAAGTETSTSIPNLINDGTYTFRVAAVNQVGQGPFSDYGQPFTVPPARTVVTPPISSLADVKAQSDALLSITDPVSLMDEFSKLLAGTGELLNKRDPGIDPFNDRATVAAIFNDWENITAQLEQHAASATNGDQARAAELSIAVAIGLSIVPNNLETLMNKGDLIGAQP